jgi:lysophospholipase L1-like esterase
MFIGLVLLAGSCTARLNKSGTQANTMEAKKIVFMGNSITEQWADYSPAFFEGKPWVNKGVSGQVSWEMLDRFQADVIDEKPDIVVILAGTNDVAGNQGLADQHEILGNIWSMVDRAREAGIDVILCSIPPAFDFPWNAGQAPAIRIPALNILLEERAGKNGIIYADYFKAMANADNGMKEGLAYDGVHPNEAGYAVMESVLTEAIQAVLDKQ